MAKRKPKFEVVENAETELCRKKKFTEHDIISFQAANDRQHEFLQYFESKTPCILLDGYPGTGKTFLALISALRQVVDPSTHYEKIVYIRSAVEAGQSIGFLPGTEEEKYEPYELPAREMFAEITKYNDPYANLKALGYVEFRLDNFLRGLNLRNAIVVVDEAQNMDYSSLRTIMTRLASGSRVIVCGDELQDDLQRKKKKSGFSHLKYVLGKMPRGSFSHVHFETEDIVRSGFVRDYVVADVENPEI